MFNRSSVTAAPRLRELAGYCLPALLLGLGLRLILCAYMPLAFFGPDTNEFFHTHLFGGSRTFLPRLIYGLPGWLGLPLMPSIAVIQHAFGMVMILGCGGLCAQWLSAWRWWIVPFTCLIAVQPTLLWYEHFALPDSTFTLTLVLACLAGGRLYRRADGWSFALFFATLFLVAGARQEGFLFLAFGVALAARTFWGEWRKFRVFVPLACALALVTAALTKTNQGGYMLLTSLIQWAPDHIRTEPELSSRVVELREHFKTQWPAYPDAHNASRKIIVAKVDDYLREKDTGSGSEIRNRSGRICQRVALEIAARNFWRLPVLAFHKFRAMHHERPAPDFGPGWAHVKQLDVLFGQVDRALPKDHKYTEAYLGRDYVTREELQEDLPRLYRVMPGDWLSRFQDAFYEVEYAGTLLPARQVGTQTLPALPLLYLFSAAGLLFVFLREGRALTDKQLWLLMLLFQASVICLTGSLRSRYRLSFEPWFLLGFFGFLDSLVFVKGRIWGKPTKEMEVESAE